MELTEHRAGEFWVIELSGQLKSSGQAELQQKLSGIIERGEKKIVINCPGLTYITSSGLRILLMALKKATAAGGELRLAGLTGNIREIMVISGFASIFNIYGTLDEALKVDE